jgi:putative oxygen-independent coproporphyrinogen III oxidase
MIPQAPLDDLTGLSAARFGVYVHFPYCLSKCPYCDFASVVARAVPHQAYARALLSEPGLRLEVHPPLSGRAVHSIFFGGGTPSLWAPSCIESILDAMVGAFQIAEGAEITLEANPNAADASRFRDYRQAGVNRLSIGVQSFEVSTLSALGRDHDGDAADRAFAAARAAGFENVSMDFIIGVHGQTLRQAISDAERAVSLEPEHLSSYTLTLESELLAEEVPLSRQLSRGELTLPSDEEALAMAQAVREIYAQHGLRRYEISNFARLGYHSRHNSLYWTGGEYLGLGAGAAGFLRTADSSYRYSNHRSPERYFAELAKHRLPEASRETLSRQELFEERLAMGLRLSTGIDLEAVCGAYGQSVAPRRSEADRLRLAGFARLEGNRFSLTDAGADLHSSISARLI